MLKTIQTWHKRAKTSLKRRVPRVFWVRWKGAPVFCRVKPQIPRYEYGTCGRLGRLSLRISSMEYEVYEVCMYDTRRQRPVCICLSRHSAQTVTILPLRAQG